MPSDPEKARSWGYYLSHLANRHPKECPLQTTAEVFADDDTDQQSPETDH